MTPSRSPESLPPMEVVARGDDLYPTALLDLHNPPARLWGIGDWSMIAPPVVAVVGTRRCTPYGERTTREIAGALARGGACIVSGLAFGIDATAHRAALDAGGRTIAVLGTGVDVVYPRAHRALYREIATKGLLLSELPPGSPCHQGSFPNRNRIIAALARATIVVEAPFGSGALYTSDHALKLDRSLACVPGPIDSAASAASNELLRDGAIVIARIEDALMLAGLSAPVRSSPVLETAAEQRVWSELEQSAATLDTLCARSGLPVAECLAAVTALEIRGAIECALSGEIRKR